METLSSYAALANGSSMASTLVGTTGPTTEERLAGEDHAEIRYFTRYVVPNFPLLVPLLMHRVSYDHHGEFIGIEILEAQY